MQKAIIFPKHSIDCKGLDERVSMHIYVFFFFLKGCTRVYMVNKSTNGVR